MNAVKKLTLAKALPWLLIVCGLIGLLCSFALTVDKMELLKNPGFKPACNLNPILSCGSVMNTDEASIFGFDNTFIGLAGFGALTAIGVAMLAGGKFKRWFWLCMEAGAIGGLLMVHFLIASSLYVIHVLCPYCMVVWTITITLFWYITLYNIQEGHIRLKGKAQQAAQFARRHHIDILVLWFLLIFVLILKQFWYYYGPGLGF